MPSAGRLDLDLVCRAIVELGEVELLQGVPVMAIHYAEAAGCLAPKWLRQNHGPGNDTRAGCSP